MVEYIARYQIWREDSIGDECGSDLKDHSFEAPNKREAIRLAEAYKGSFEGNRVSRVSFVGLIEHN